MSVLDLFFWWVHDKSSSLPTGTLTSSQQAYVMARAGNICERRQPGCGITATHIDLSDKSRNLAAVHRHPDYPDNWVASCGSCTQLSDLGGS